MKNTITNGTAFRFHGRDGGSLTRTIELVTKAETAKENQDITASTLKQDHETNVHNPQHETQKRRNC